MLPSMSPPIRRSIRLALLLNLSSRLSVSPHLPTRLNIHHIHNHTRLSKSPLFLGTAQRQFTTTSPHKSITDRQPEKSGLKFQEFNLTDRVYIVTGGARGLGLTLAEALVEAGGHVYCLDRLPQPSDTFNDTQSKLSHAYSGSLHYRKVDVQDVADLNSVIADIAQAHQRLDGLVAAAGIQHVCPALEYPVEKVNEMLSVNFTGVYCTAVACAKQMIRWKTPGAMCLIGSMSGLIANKGLLCSVYNSSKAAVIQLGRSLAMEWGVMKEFDEVALGSERTRVPGCSVRNRGIRVNVLCPGNILTPVS